MARGPLQLVAALVHAGEVEDVVDQDGQPFALLQEHLVVAPALLIRGYSPRLEHLGQLPDGGERALELVGDRGDDVRLHARELELMGHAARCERESERQDPGQEQERVEINSAPRGQKGLYQPRVGLVQLQRPR